MGLFKDSLKKWFYTQSSRAASSNALVPLLNADGTPKGSDTMDNLASVLGVHKPTSIPSNVDLNDYKEVGLFYCLSSATSETIINRPEDTNGHFCLEVLSCGGNMIQRLTFGSGSTFFMRRYQKSSNIWYNWYKYEGTIL